MMMMILSSVELREVERAVLFCVVSPRCHMNLRIRLRCRPQSTIARMILFCFSVLFVCQVIAGENFSYVTGPCTAHPALRACEWDESAVPILRQCYNISCQDLDLHNVDIEEVGCDTFGPFGHYLTSLTLADNFVSQLQLHTFANLTVLQSLDLSGNVIKSLTSSDFPLALKWTLTSLILENNLIASLPEDIFLDFRQLTRLDLRDNVLESLSNVEFSALSSTLQHFNVAENALTSIASDTFGELRMLENLELFSNSELAGVVVGSFRGLVALHSLWMSGTSIGPSVTPGIFNHTDMPVISTLQLYGGALERLESNAFDTLSSLTSLYLQRNRIDVVEAGAFNGLTSLNSLDLSSNRIQDLPSGVFDPLVDLHELDLEENFLETLHTNVFGSVFASRRFRRLQLGSNSIRYVETSAFRQVDCAIQSLSMKENPSECACTTNTEHGPTCVCAAWAGAVVNKTGGDACVPLETWSVEAVCSDDVNMTGCARKTTTATAVAAARTQQAILPSGSIRPLTEQQTGYLQCNDTRIDVVGQSLVKFGTAGGDSIVVSGIGTSNSSSNNNVSNSEWLLYAYEDDGDETDAEIESKKVSARCVRDDTVIRCATPSGTGRHKRFDLRYGEWSTGLLNACTFDYADPVVHVIAGCTPCRDLNASSAIVSCLEDDGDGDNANDKYDDVDNREKVTSVHCGRSGGDTVLLYGANFGEVDGSVFINGHACLSVEHAKNDTQSPCVATYPTKAKAVAASVFCPNCTNPDRARQISSSEWTPCAAVDVNRWSPHNVVVCRLPALATTQSEDTNVVVIQSNIFGAQVGLMRYKECEPGEKQDRYVEADKTTSSYYACDRCLPGFFSSLEDETYCHGCPTGKYSAQNGSSACVACPENTYSVPALHVTDYDDQTGASSCMSCPKGKSSDEGSNSCDDCDLWHYGSDHCEAPVMGVLLSLFLVIVGVLTVAYVYRKNRQLWRRIRRVVFDLDNRTEDVKLMAAAWELSWDKVQLTDEIARGSFGSVHRAMLGRWGTSSFVYVFVRAGRKSRVPAPFDSLVFFRLFVQQYSAPPHSPRLLT